MAMKPLFYAARGTIFQRPIKTARGGVTLGFAVCDVRDGIDPNMVCAILNIGEKPPADEPE